MADYQAMVAELRSAGIRAEVYLGNPKNFGNQLKYADRRGSPAAVIEGGGRERQAASCRSRTSSSARRSPRTPRSRSGRSAPRSSKCPRAELVARGAGRCWQGASHDATAPRETRAGAAALRAVRSGGRASRSTARSCSPPRRCSTSTARTSARGPMSRTIPRTASSMLRPDFTVPVAAEHMSDGAEPARYTYSGEVFRRQEDHPERASEYLQVGFEVFDGTDPARGRCRGLRAVLGGAGAARAARRDRRYRHPDRRRAGRCDVSERAARRAPAPHLAAAALPRAARPLSRAAPRRRRRGRRCSRRADPMAVRRAADRPAGPRPRSRARIDALRADAAEPPPRRRGGRS